MSERLSPRGEEDVTRVKNCDAYMGLFGHRYGWIPPGFTRSITELDFRWAVEHWSQPVPPIFVLLPEKGSEADENLAASARPLLAREFPDEHNRAAAVRAQQDFLASVINWVADGRILVYYRNQTLQLVGKALSCIQHWNQKLLRQAYNDVVDSQPEISLWQIWAVSAARNNGQP